MALPTARALAVTIGAAARAARTRAGLTQEEVAERLGLAPEVYGRLERGGMLPSVQTLRRLSVCLNLPSDVMLGLGDGEKRLEVASPPPEEPRALRRLVRTARALSPLGLGLLCRLASGLRRLEAHGGRAGRKARRSQQVSLGNTGPVALGKPDSG